VERAEVKTGLSNDTHIVVLSGLAAQDRVVTGPYRVLKDLDDGDPVRAELEGDDGDDDDSADPPAGDAKARAESPEAK
jgi:hypothetical protein